MSAIAKRFPAGARRVFLKRMHDGQVKNVIVEDKRTVKRQTKAMKQRKYQVKTLRSWSKSEQGTVAEVIGKLADRLELQKLHEEDLINGYKAYAGEVAAILKSLKTEDKLEDKLNARKKDLKKAEAKLKSTLKANEKAATLPDFDRKEAERQEDFARVAVRTAQDGVENAKKTLGNAEEETEKQKVAQLKAGMMYLSESMARYHRECGELAAELGKYAAGLDGDVEVKEVPLVDKDIGRNKGKKEAPVDRKEAKKEAKKNNNKNKKEQEQAGDDDHDGADAPEQPTIPGAAEPSTPSSKTPVVNKPEAGVAADVSGTAAQVA